MGFSSQLVDKLHFFLIFIIAVRDVSVFWSHSFLCVFLSYLDSFGVAPNVIVVPQKKKIQLDV